MSVYDMPSESFEENHPFSTTCRRPTADRSLAAGGDQRHPLRASLPYGQKPQCPTLNHIDPRGPDAYREAKGSAGLAFSSLFPNGISRFGPRTVNWRVTS